MDQMTITYLVTAFTGIYALGSIAYYVKNKRFIGRNAFAAIASVVVCILGVISIVKGIPITQLQYLIESTF
ncbi:MAG: hypothetical protein CSB16_01885 [Clostridiales bacterium]|nr:MAG: hypothetical protein CSB16_01885 [Clostridiales bacterium]